MDGNTRRQLKIISDELKRHKRNPRARTVVNGNTVITSEIKAGEKPGVFIDKDSFITMLKQATCSELQILEAKTANSLLVAIP